MSVYTVPGWAGDVSHETMAQLSRYAALILKWNPTINLVGKTTETDIWNRHIWDSYQLLPLVPRETKTVADLGCGAGLPGLVLAIANPNLHVTLVERDIRKSTFLREAARALDLQNATVLAQDANNLTQTFDLITSRALASLAELCAFSLKLVGKGGNCLFPKGENFAKEVEEARQLYAFQSHVIHSKTNEKAGIVSLSELKPL